jgi:rhamnosyltransferase
MINILKVSILIPTLNAGRAWIKVLESINEQTIEFEKKIIVDSGSIDNTVPLARQYGFEVIEIEKKSFNHGATRQLLADASINCDVCVFLTHDATLASMDSVEKIVSIFQDADIGMAYGRQLPHINARPLERHARLFNYPSVSQVISMDDLPRLGFKIFFGSNSFSAYRKIALSAVGGFPPDSIMGEDAIVAAKMLMAGFKKAYVAEATVYHSHSYTLAEEYKRYFDTRVFHEQNKWLIDTFGKPTSEGIKYIKSEVNYVVKNDFKTVIKSIGSIGAKWLGYKTGRFYKILPVSILKKLSMHKSYWK